MQELDRLQREAKKTDAAFDSIGKKIGLAGSTIKAGLAAGATALVGTGLAKFLSDSADAFGDAAKAAGELAQATGGTVEEVSRMRAALQDSGISAEQSAALLTKFTTNAGKNKDALRDLGVELKTNADGSTDFADAMVQTVDAINDIGDASQRNQEFIKLFGKQGATAFQELAASGVDLADAMEAISRHRVFTAEDVSKAVAYDDAMDNLGASVQGLQFALGKEVIPALASMASGFASVVSAVTPLIGVLGDIPQPVLLSVAAFTALKAAMASTFGQAALQGVLNFGVALAQMGSWSAIAAAGLTTLKGAIAGVVAVAKPLLAITAVVTVAEGLASVGDQLKDFTRNSENAGKSLSQMAEEGVKTDSVVNSMVTGFFSVVTGMSQVDLHAQQLSKSLEAQADSILASADATDAQKQAAQELKDVMGEGNREAKTNRLRTDEGTKAIEGFEQAVGGADAALQKMQQSQKDVANLAQDIVAGTGSWDDFNAKVKESADLQDQNEAATRLTNIAMAEYGTAAERASAWQAELNAMIEDGATSGSQFQQAVRETAEAMHDSETNTRLAEEALDKFNFTLGDVLDDLADTDPWKAGPESLKQALGSLDFKEDPARWGDEWKIAAEQARQNILQALGEMELDPVSADAFLEELKKDAPPQVRKVIEQIQSDIKSNPLTIPTDVKTPTPDEIRARIADINSVLSSTWNEQVIGPLKGEKKGLEESLAVKIPVAINLTGAVETQTQITELTAPKATTITLDAVYSPGYEDQIARRNILASPIITTATLNAAYSPPYEAMVLRRDVLATPITATATLNAIYNPGYNDMVLRRGVLAAPIVTTATLNAVYSPDYNDMVLRRDVLSRSLESHIAVHQDFPDGGYGAYVARLDYLSMNRTATITVRTQGVDSARSAIRDLTSPENQAVPQVRMPQPINFLRVEVDGQSLRGVVRDEVGKVTGRLVAEHLPEPVA